MLVKVTLLEDTPTHKAGKHLEVDPLRASIWIEHGIAEEGYTTRKKATPKKVKDTKDD